MAYKTEPLKASIRVRLSLKLCNIFYGASKLGFRRVLILIVLLKVLNLLSLKGNTTNVNTLQKTTDCDQI